jgi:hypothetical protein
MLDVLEGKKIFVVLKHDEEIVSFFQMGWDEIYHGI